MFGIGMPEMLLLLAIALVVIGPKKLPDLAKSLGRAMREFKKATNELKETMHIDDDLADVKKAFNDISNDVKQTVDSKFESGKHSNDQLKSDRPDSDQKETEKGESDPDDGKFENLKNLKQAFDNMDTSSNSSAAKEAAPPEQDPKDKTKGPDDHA
jgi:TatA/E family protein of Tat protein translocase